MNNMENIHPDVFDWIKRTAYAGLSETQKKEVTPFFSPEEYDELHLAARLIGEATGNKTDRKQHLKQEALAAFDRRHPQAHKPQLVRLMPAVWKAAAVFLAIGLPLSMYWLIKGSNPALTNHLDDKTDTVYIERLVTEKPVKVYDTVYIVKEEQANPVKHNRRAAQPVKARMPETLSRVQGGELQIQSIEKLDAIPNKLKRNSIHDDSLLNHYGFVTL